MHVNSETSERRRLARAFLLGGGLLLAAAQWGLWRGVEPIATWSYDLSWWSAILLADAVVYLRTGSSILLSRTSGFFGLALASGAYWLLYECANLRLANWYYVGIPPDRFTQTVGVYVSFATVLPGVLVIHTLLGGSAARTPRAPSPLPARARALLYGAGIACLVLPLLFPRQAYPLVWGAAFLLLEPWLASRDERSLLARLLAGDRGPLVRMLATGLVTGAMWETWNWRSPAKWIYTVPLFEDGKLFEMPYLGFVGFVPFALGCHSFARALVVARCIPEWDPRAAPRRAEPVRASVAGVAALAFSFLAIALVDRFTIHSTRPTLADLPGMSQETERRLEASGIRRPEDLVAAPEAVDSGCRERWVEAARLMSVRGMGKRGLDWLAGAGVSTVEDLAARDPDVLSGDVLSSDAGPPPRPSPAEIRVWVRGAR